VDVACCTAPSAAPTRLDRRLRVHDPRLQWLKGIIQENIFLTGFIMLMQGVDSVIGTLISDILLAVVDPRIRLTGR
jgi:hypothetical protein